MLKFLKIIPIKFEENSYRHPDDPRIMIYYKMSPRTEYTIGFFIGVILTLLYSIQQFLMFFAKRIYLIVCVLFLTVNDIHIIREFDSLSLANGLFHLDGLSTKHISRILFFIDFTLLCAVASTVHKVLYYEPEEMEERIFDDVFEYIVAFKLEKKRKKKDRGQIHGK